MKRPTVATVFGVLNIIFGGFGLLSLLSIGTTFSMSPILGVFSLVNLCVSIILLISGLFLIMSKKMAVSMTKYYAILSVIVTLAYAGYLVFTAGILGLMVAIVAVIIGLVYPILLWFLIINNKAVQQYYGSQK